MAPTTFPQTPRSFDLFSFGLCPRDSVPAPRMICYVAVRANQAREHRRSAGPTAWAPLHGGRLRPQERIPMDHHRHVLQPVVGPLRARPVLPVGEGVT